MITIEKLKDYGANVDEGLMRCMNNEGFYLKLVEKSIKDAAFDKLAAAVEEHDLDAAFEAAHQLKGAFGNLALTPIFEPVNEMTDLLRGRTEADYETYLRDIEAKRKELEELSENM